jgi:hypothetical protein
MRGGGQEVAAKTTDSAEMTQPAPEDGHDGDGGVAAHKLLTSSSVVSMGISTLLVRWNQINDADRTHLLRRMLVHASSIDDHLKASTQGRGHRH